MNDGLWFYWGSERLPFLRYMTLRSAALYHRRLILVRRREPTGWRELPWHERQDFQLQQVPDWSDRLPLLGGLRTVWLEDIAPQVAALGLPDVQTKDLLNWAILASAGGTVADMDLLFRRAPQPISADVHLVRYRGLPREGYHTISLVQGRPCETWRRAYGRAYASARPEVYDSAGWVCIPEGLEGSLDERTCNPWAGMEWSNYRKFLWSEKTWPAIGQATVAVEWYGGSNAALGLAVTGPDAIPRRGAVAAELRRVLEECKAKGEPVQ